MAADREQVASLDRGQTSAAWRPAAVDVPTASLPLIARVERLASPVRAATAELASGLDSRTTTALARRLACPDPLLDDPHRVVPTPERVARSALAAWLIAYVRQDLLGPGPSVSVRSAIAWFWDLDTDSPDPDALYAVRVALDRHGTAEAEGLLPYVLDPFGLTTRRAVLTGSGDRAERRTRKKVGTFYTPGDVARLLSEEAITARDGSVLDPACGAGVFLRAAFSRLCCDLGVPASTAVRRLYGVDIDPRAIDACAFVLAHDWLAREPDSNRGVAGTRWRELRLNLAVANSLRAFSSRMPLDLAPPHSREERAGLRENLKRRLRRGERAGLAPVDGLRPSHAWERFPEVATSRFGSVLMNPPFASAGPGLLAEPELIADYRTLAAASNPAGVNLAWPFLEVAVECLAPSGRAGVVLPLGLAYRTDPTSTALRAFMSEVGAWQLRFFDRAPDAVFGDDVKQRVCLASVSKGGPARVTTSRLIRWSSAHRGEVFRSTSAIGPVVAPDHGAPFPKIGTQLEASVLDHLRALEETLGNAATDTALMRPSDLRAARSATVSVAPTAYNWIGAYRDPALAADGRAGATGKVNALRFADDLQADAAYALISSRVFLWWWRAIGDLFHVPLRMLAKAPFPIHLVGDRALRDLVEAGRSLWREAHANPVRSTNRGVAITAYVPPRRSPELDATDGAVAAAFDLRAAFVRFVREDAERLANAGRGG